MWDEKRIAQSQKQSFFRYSLYASRFVKTEVNWLQSEK